jgi:predicted transcriptional regulator
MGRASKTARQLFEYLEQNPIIEIRKTAAALDMAFSTVSAAVNRLCEVEILVQSAGGQRNRTFSYEAYLDLLQKSKIMQAKLEKSAILRMNGTGGSGDCREVALCLRKASIKKP